MSSSAKSFFAIVLLAISTISASSAQTSRQWRDSLSAINKLIAVSPYSSDLHLRKAAFNLQLEQWEYAIDEYGLVLDKDADCPAAYFYRAYANTKLRRYERAHADYEAFLRLVPRNMEAMLGLAHVNTKLGRTADALDQLNRTVELYPDSAVVYAARAGIERDLKAYDLALYDWTNAVMLAPGNADFAISRIDVMLLLGRKAAARAELDALVKRGIPRGTLREWYARCK